MALACGRLLFLFRFGGCGGSTDKVLQRRAVDVNAHVITAALLGKCLACALGCFLVYLLYLFCLQRFVIVEEVLVQI